MRRALLAVASVCVAILATSVALAQAPPPGSFSAFGPRLYQNAPGLTAAQAATFAVLNPGAPYHVRIRNGTLVDPQYTSAFSADVLLNGVPLITFEEFNKKTTLVDKPVTLAATNALSVTVHGRPNALIEIEFLGQDVDDPLIVADVSPSPNAAGWYNSDVTVTFTCSDPTSEIASCPDEQVVTIDGTGIVVSGTAVDAAGHTAVASVTLNVDRIPPQISIGKPTDGSVSHAATVAIEGAAEDTNGVVAVTCSGVAALRVGDTFTCPASLSVGSNTLYAEAMDVAGNPAIASVGVTRDPDFTAPAIAITSPAPLALYSATTVTVTGTVDDPEAIVDVNGRPATLSPAGSGATFTVNDVSLKEGSNLIAATAKDSVDNSTTVSLQVVRDTIPPVVTIENPADGTTTIESSVVVTGMINEMVVGTFNNEQGTVIVNGAPASVENRTFAAPGVALAIGPNTITAIGTDRAGNSVTVHSTVTRIAAVGRRIETLSGSGQNGIVSAPLANPLAVVVKDETGSPVSGATVIFRVVENNGTLAAGIDAGKRALAVPTDATGRAEAAWTLGSRAGASNNRVEAYSVGYEGTAIFTAGAASGTPSEILVDAGNAQTGATGQKLPRPLVVVVADSGHNRIEGTSVTFTVTSGGASFDGQPSVTTVTDGDGRAAAIPTLGSNEGVATTRIQATFSGNAGAPVTFIASSLNAGDAADTTIAGVVLDNANTPVPGATVKIQGTILQTITSPQGQFKITGAPVGEVLLIIDGATTTRPGTWPMLEFDLVTVAGRENTVGMPIYLLPLDVANGVMVDETHGGTVTLPEIPGFALEVAPNSATFLDGSKSGRVHVTAVHTDKVPMLPSFGSQPRLTVTIQPMGIHFDPPARLTVPNFDSLPPGSLTDMYSFDHDLGQFVGIGTGTVSEDGTVVRSDPGVGVVKGGWHWAGPPTPVGDLSPCFGSAGGAGLRPDEDSCCQRTECQSCVGGAPIPQDVGTVTVEAFTEDELNTPTTVLDTARVSEFHIQRTGGNCDDPRYEWAFPGAKEIDNSHTSATLRVRYEESGPQQVELRVKCGGCSTVLATVQKAVTVYKVTIDGAFKLSPSASASETDTTEDKDQASGDMVLRVLGGTRIRIKPVTIEPQPSGTPTMIEWSTDGDSAFYDGPGTGAHVRSGSGLQNPTVDQLYWQGSWHVDKTWKLRVDVTLADGKKIRGERKVMTRVLRGANPEMSGDDVGFLRNELRLLGHSGQTGKHFGWGGTLDDGTSYDGLTAQAVRTFRVADRIRSKSALTTSGELVDDPCLAQIQRHWDDYRKALESHLDEAQSGSPVCSSEPTIDTTSSYWPTWRALAILGLQATYKDDNHTALKTETGATLSYEDFLDAWVKQEASQGQWGHLVPYRVTLGSADPWGSIGFSQVLSQHVYGPKPLTLTKLLNLYKPGQSVQAFATFNSETDSTGFAGGGGGLYLAFHGITGSTGTSDFRVTSGTDYPRIGSAGGYVDKVKDLLSKGLASYNGGSGKQEYRDLTWPEILRDVDPPPANDPNFSFENALHYAIQVAIRAHIPLSSWTWTEQVITTGPDTKCDSAPSGADEYRAPNPQGPHFQVCIVAAPKRKLDSQVAGNDVPKTFSFTYTETDWYEPRTDRTGITWTTKRNTSIPASIP